MTKTTGTQEWCYKELNICKGCPNNCVYCYAKGIAKRFGWKKDWEDMEIIEKKVKKGYMKLKNPNPNVYDYMFPTSHDIVPFNLEACVIVLKKILRAGNTVLIVTKPNYDCIVRLCKELEKWKEQICFRFTIGSKNNTILKKYEPNASLYMERYLSLKHASIEGFKTSVSIEPYLDDQVFSLIFDLEMYVNDTIWIGIWRGKSKGIYSNVFLISLINEIERIPKEIRDKIRLKDSIINRGFELNSRG